MIISSVSETNDMLITSHLGADSLPGLVQNCLDVATTTPMKDMLLLSVLTNCAYALPAMRCLRAIKSQRPRQRLRTKHVCKYFVHRGGVGCLYNPAKPLRIPAKQPL